MCAFLSRLPVESWTTFGGHSNVSETTLCMLSESLSKFILREYYSDLRYGQFVGLEGFISLENFRHNLVTLRPGPKPRDSRENLESWQVRWSRYKPNVKAVVYRKFTGCSVWPWLVVRYNTQSHNLINGGLSS